MASSEQISDSSLETYNITSFEELYKQYYIYLCLISQHIVRNHNDAEEIVSDVFVKLWNMRDRTGAIKSIKAYLIKAVHNASLNLIEQNNKRSEHTDLENVSALKVLTWDSDYPLGQLFEKELLETIKKGINDLPESCREIFLLSRDKEMNYDEISRKLGISINTVKTQMKIALSRMREVTRKYMQ
jgi:RNA polymerase sigma-70 factor (ECF subfamily)